MEPSDPTDRGRYYADITVPEAAARGATPRHIPRRSSNPLPYARSRRPSIRLLRMPLGAQSSISRPVGQGGSNNRNNANSNEPDDYFSRRRRSGSLPVCPTFQPDSIPPDNAGYSQAGPSTGPGASARPGVFKTMGTSARSMLNRGRSWVAENPSEAQNQPDEYRNDAVDLLDVVGKAPFLPYLEVHDLTSYTSRPRGFYPHDAYKCPKLLVCS